jgi:hypothetical protein
VLWSQDGWMTRAEGMRVQVWIETETKEKRRKESEVWKEAPFYREVSLPPASYHASVSSRPRL